MRELAAGQDQWHSTSGLTFSPDDRRLVSDYPLAVWDLETGALTFTLSSATRPSTALAFSPEGARLAVATTDEAVPDAGGYGNSDGKVVLWSLADGTAPRVVASHENTIRGLAFTPDGGHIIAGSADASVSARSSGQEGAVRLWDVASGEVAVALASFDAESSSTGVAVSPDGRLLAAVVLPFAPSKPSHSGISAFTNASYRAVLRLWDAATGKPLREIHVGSDTAVGLAMSGDGARIAVLSGRDVLVWSTRTGRPVNRIPIEAPTANVNLQAHGNEELTAAAWLPDNRRLVVSGGRGVLGIWDVLTSIAVNRFDGVSADVKAIAVDPTGRYIAAGDCDGLLRVWAAPRWHLAFTRAAHQGCVTAVAFGPSGQLASSGEDGVTRLWDETGNWRAAIATVRNTDDWLVIGPDGRYDGTATGERTAIAFRQSTSAWSPEQFAGRCGPPICCPAERATPATALPPCLGL